MNLEMVGARQKMTRLFCANRWLWHSIITATEGNHRWKPWSELRTTVEPSGEGTE